MRISMGKRTPSDEAQAWGEMERYMAECASIRRYAFKQLVKLDYIPQSEIAGGVHKGS